jgi:putative FmdB family regulatory protein
MPIYEYACEKCEHEFEREQRITDDPVKTCPVCRSRRVKKLISLTSFVLKGGGWYADAYSSSKAKSDSDEAGAKSKDSKSEESKSGASESKSESKSDAKSDKGSKSDSKKGGKSSARKNAA